MILQQQKVKKFEFQLILMSGQFVGGTVYHYQALHNSVTYPSNYNYSFNKTASDAISNP